VALASNHVLLTLRFDAGVTTTVVANRINEFGDRDGSGFAILPNAE